MPLLDQFGNKINFATLKQEEASATVAGVRSNIPNYASSNLTPVKLARILRNADQGDIEAYLELAEEMEEKELQYLSVLGTRKRAVSQLDITVEASDDSNQAERHADFIKDFIARDTLSEELFDILDAIGKGFSISEIIWDCSEKQWIPKSIQRVNPIWFRFDANGKTPFLKTQNGLEPLSPYKYITAFMKAKSGLPIRSGLARPIAWYYLFKNYDVKSWITFLEVYGQPLRIGKYGSNASEEDKQTLLKAVYNVGSDTAAIIPESMMIDFVKADQANATELYERFATYADLAISKAVLGQTTTTDAVSGGHAVSQEHNDVRKDIMRSDAKQLEAILTRDIIRPMIDLNFGVQKAYPKIKIGSEDEEDITALADALSKLIPTGLKVSASQVRSKLGLEEPKNESDVLGYVDPEPATQTPALNQQKALNEIQKNKDDFDLAVEEASEDWQEVIEPMIKPIEAILEHCSSYEEAFEKLAEAYPKMDSSVLTEKLAQLMFKANLNGRLTHE